MTDFIHLPVLQGYSVLVPDPSVLVEESPRCVWNRGPGEGSHLSLSLLLLFWCEMVLWIDSAVRRFVSQGSKRDSKRF